MDQRTLDRGPLQDLVTECCWGAVWARGGLPLKIRSMVNLARGARRPGRGV